MRSRAWVPPVGRTERLGRRGWLDLVRDASDLALLGILTTIGSLGVVTVGAAIATASFALRHWQEYGHWPTARQTLGRYGRSVLPGVPVTVLGAATAALLAVNVSAFARGVVPGGPALTALTLLVAGALAGFAALTAVEVGCGDGWRAAARRASLHTGRRPVTLVALAGVTLLAALLAATVTPVTIPILVGYALFAGHAVARRLPADG